MFRSIAVAAWLSLSVVAFAGDTIEDIEKKLEEAAKKVKSYTAKIKTATDAEFAPGMSVKSTAEGTMELLIRDGKTLSRVEFSETGTQNFTGQEVKTAAKTLIVSDGSVQWILREETDGAQKGHKTCMKAAAQGDPVGLKQTKKDFNLKAMPEEKVDGQECWVVEMTPKAGTPAAGGPANMRTVAYYRKDNGIAVKTVSFMEAKPISTMTMSDVKLDASVSDDRFVFKKPDGVEVTDMTAMGAPAETEAKPAEKSAKP
jgi:outer membrane lipoprotein-sorting protein